MTKSSTYRMERKRNQSMPQNGSGKDLSVGRGFGPVRLASHGAAGVSRVSANQGWAWCCLATTDRGGTNGLGKWRKMEDIRVSQTRPGRDQAN
jgi:hypothetical protein